MEIIEGVVDLIPVLSLTVGIWLAALTYWIWLALRRRLWGLDRTLFVETPEGDEYSLRVPAVQLRTPISRRLTKSQMGDSRRAPEQSEDHELHPTKLSNATGEMLILVVVPILVGVLLLVIVLVLELILGVLVFGLAWLVAALVRYRWSCVVSGPSGNTWVLRERGLRRIREVRDETAGSIRSGHFE